MLEQLNCDAFSRNIGILTEAEQKKLADTCVAVAGLGGIGGNVLVLLARMGIGKFRIADFDRFEAVNINRQYGARSDTIGAHKCEVLAREVRLINPAAEIEIVPEGFSEATADTLLDGAHIAVDAVDFYAIDAHLSFHRKTRERGLYTLIGSAVGFSACLQTFDPNGMSLEDYCGITPEMPDLEKHLRYACGIVPELLHIDYFDVSRGASNTDFLKRTGPSLSVACSLAASLVAAEVVLIRLERRPPRVIPHSFQFDPYTYRYARTYVEGGMTNYDPGPAIKKIKDRSSLVPQVLELFYRKKRAHKAAVNGIDLYYRIEGEGRPLLLIAPLGADTSFWSRQVPDFAKRYQVIAFDNCGSGESGSRNELSTQLMATDAIALVESLGLASVSVAGLALGGLIAQEMAVLRPDLVERLVLASSYMKADEQVHEVTRGWREMAQRDGMEPLFETCVDSLFSPRYMAENRDEIDRLKTFYRLTMQDADDFCRQSEAGVAHDSEPIIGKIACPTLVIHGAGDRLVAPRLGRALAERLPDARFSLIERAPHFLNWEQAATFNREFIQFLG